MIDFDEEVLKFQPSMDLDRVEDNISEEKLRDITDIVTNLAKSMQEMQSYQLERKFRDLRSDMNNSYDNY
jgi:hypothetical protein